MRANRLELPYGFDPRSVSVAGTGRPSVPVAGTIKQ
jgi:hypothetical protein